MPSFALHGLGVSGGIAIGRAQLVSHATLEVAHYTIPSARVESEIARLDHALSEVRAELEGLHDAMTAGDAPAEFGAFLDVHAMILADPTLSETPKRIIAEQHCNAEWALTQQMNVLVEQFEEIEDAYLRERKADVVQVVERVLKRLLGKPGSLVPAGRGAAHDPGRARSVAGGRDPVQDAPLRRLHHRSRRRHLAHGDRRAEPRRARGRRHAQRPRADPRERAPDPRRDEPRRHRQSRQVGARRVPAEAERARARAGQAAPPQDEAGDDPRRVHDRAPGEHRVAGRPRAGARQRRHGHRALPLGVPVPEPRRAAVGGRAVRGVSQRGRRNGRQAGDDPHVRSRRRQAQGGPRRPRPRRAESGAWPARGPVLPRRAAALPDAAPRDPARVALRQGEDPGADARFRRRDRPDARDDRAGEGDAAGAGRALRCGRRGGRHDRDSGGGARDLRASSRSSTSCRSAPTTSSSTRWRWTAPTTPSRTCTIRSIPRC